MILLLKRNILHLQELLRVAIFFIRPSFCIVVLDHFRIFSSRHDGQYLRRHLFGSFLPIIWCAKRNSIDECSIINPLNMYNV